MTAIIRLATMCGAAVTEEAGGIRVSAEPEVLEAFDFSAFEARADVAGQVEHSVVFARRRLEEPFACWVAGVEALNELRPDLIVGLPDQRADRGRDARARSAELFHRRDRRLEYAGEGAFPARMRSADHAGLRVREQDRAAVRGGG